MNITEEYPDFFIEHSPFGFILVDDNDDTIIFETTDDEDEDIEFLKEDELTVCMV